MPHVETEPDHDFWSDTYRGRRLAVFNHHGRRHAYLDHMFQPHVVFASADNAVTWLTARVDLAAQRAA